MLAVFAAVLFRTMEYFKPNPEERQRDIEGAARGPLTGERVGAFLLPSEDLRVIALVDEIGAGAALDFRRVLRLRPEATDLVLASPGGSVNEALLIAHQVADLKLATSVPTGTGCYSACAYIFFAGESRVAVGELGVHQVYGDGVDASGAQTVLSDVLDALAEFDVPQDVISAMLRTLPGEMHVLTASELALVNIGKPAAADVGKSAAASAGRVPPDIGL